MKFTAPLVLLAVAEGAELEAEWSGMNRGLGLQRLGGYGLGMSRGYSNLGMSRSHGLNRGYGLARSSSLGYGRMNSGYGMSRGYGSLNRGYGSSMSRGYGMAGW